METFAGLSSSMTTEVRGGGNCRLPVREKRKFVTFETFLADDSGPV